MTAESGKILTFYSYKGGVGRSMAVANLGRLFARDSTRVGPPVLLIDWDLEAPGLHRYFDLAQEPQHGLVDYFARVLKKLKSDSAFGETLKSDDAFIRLDDEIPLGEYVIESGSPGLWLLPAGSLDHAYSRAVATLNWAGLFETWPQAIWAFRHLLASRYTVTLIDSRTGVSDVTGMCTSLLPDKLIAMFAPNQQNYEGLFQVLEIALESRRNSENRRPLVVFPLASRFDDAELTMLQTWLNRFRDEFTRFFVRVYGLESCDLTDYFHNVLLLYVPRYSYGEINVVDRMEPNYPGSLRRSLEAFANLLTERDVPWNERSDHPS